jgi:hypothetical protein
MNTLYYPPNFCLWGSPTPDGSIGNEDACPIHAGAIKMIVSIFFISFILFLLLSQMSFFWDLSYW